MFFVDRNLSTANPTPRGLSHLSPRSARSDSVAASIPEELDDDDLELDDDISDANDLLKSDNSAVSLRRLVCSWFSTVHRALSVIVVDLVMV